MSNYIVTDTELTSIANAVRTKSGGNSSLQFPTGFVSEIQSISTGATEVAEKDVNFIDYDGTILYSYTAQEAQALEALPANPTHTGLTAQGWNWTLAQIKTQLTQVGGKVWVGQSYITTSGATEIYITLDNPDYLSPYLALGVNGEVNIDWGDNTALETMTGNGIMTEYSQQHTYAQTGEYVIKITGTSGNYTFYSASAYQDGILRTVQSGNQARNGIYNSTIKKIYIGNKVTILGNSAFSYCTSIQNITIPSSVTTIYANVFYMCYKLQSITLPSTITSLPSSLCYSCYNLRNIAIPPSITSIESSAFNSCYIIKSITIPSSITSLNANVFQNCYTLQSVIMSSSITSIGADVFYGCVSLQTISLSSSIANISVELFYYCSTLQNITLPSSITQIKSSAFNSCRSLQKINIPSNVTTIDSSAFSACTALYNITIPSSVTTIGTQAFSNCYYLHTCHFQSTTPPTLADTKTFRNIPNECIIYVPYSADHSVLNTYGTETNWSTWTNYLKEEGENGITWAEWQALNA